LIVAELETRFPFGLVLLTDDLGTDQIPDFASASAPVTCSKTAIVVTIKHEVDGTARVRVWNAEPENRLPFEYGTWTLETASGRLRLSTADGSQFVVMDGLSSRTAVKVMASGQNYAEAIDLVVTKSAQAN
jgi:hypothetical protein